MTSRTAIVLAALVVSLAHLLSRAWLSDDGDPAGATVGALVILGAAALVWLRAPRWRAAMAPLGFLLLAAAWHGPVADLAAGEASALDVVGLAQVAAANALLAVGLWEVVGPRPATPHATSV